MFNRKKYNFLITGANGQLGSYLLSKYSKLSFKENSCVGKVFGIKREDIDLTDKFAIMDLFNRSTVDPNVKIDYVVHCAAAVDTIAIEKNPDKFFCINVLAPKWIAQTCRFNKMKMIFISSDYVLSEFSSYNPSLNAIEPFPVNAYGMQKLLAEKYIEEVFAGKDKDYMILRSSWLFGNSSRSFVEKFLNNVFSRYLDVKKRKNQHNDAGAVYYDSLARNVDCANDAFGKPTHVDFIAELILQLVQRKFYGCCDAQPLGKQISRAEWAKKILACLKLVLKEKRSFVDADLESMQVHEVKSSFLNLSVNHPGKIGYFAKTESEYSNACFFTDVPKKLRKKYIESCICAAKKNTEEYIMQNYERIAKDIIDNYDDYDEKH